MDNTEINIIKELATLDPLDDRAFRIFLSDDVQFTLLAEAFSGETLDGEKIVHMNGEIVLTAKGKLIRADSLRDTDSAFINIDGQIKTSDFPFKRHVFYTAAIYANGIKQGGAWDSLKPVISIVIYKNKGDSDLFEKAALSGNLVKTEDDGKQLIMISVNTAKWKDAPNEEIKAYLATLHHGIMTEDNKADFADIDIDGSAFTNIQRAVRIACAHTKKQDYDDEQKGDKAMSALIATYLTKEEKEAAKNEGKVEGQSKGLHIALEIFNLLKTNTPVAEIAARYQLAASEVEKFKTAL